MLVFPHRGCRTRDDSNGGNAMRKLLLFGIALAIFSLQPAASAQTSTGYRTVDSVSISYTQIHVTGVVQGESAPSTAYASFSTNTSDVQNAASFEACHRQLLLALSRPGQYVAKVGPNLCIVALATP